MRYIVIARTSIETAVIASSRREAENKAIDVPVTEWKFCEPDSGPGRVFTCYEDTDAKDGSPQQRVESSAKERAQ